ncbi:SGNH/GDSL hydrolase family protein [Synoicihabitans lomoniglobus]|uniref:SGNH/GDSL hydrolase family protein n=1 Tax=Synoicihabitans lomoniglobus TaxID=2909285 RepID=A0AAF0CGM0_9BACT|nr:SGNH/GDSL hydrolase family protein [Opitutaceae bacterium LMO-M01]WED63677.1 SGNH/GDSL hydrolase family protein [Opitutaceae bacterium LMO-M01]
MIRLARRGSVVFIAWLSLTASFMSAADTSPDLALIRARLTDTQRPLTWVMTGDSITQGAKWLGSTRSYPEQFEEVVRWHLQRRRDFFINTAISGERTDGLLADFSWRVSRFQPDVVSLMIGMNDAVAGPDGRAAYEANLRTLIASIRALGAIPVLHRTNPIDTAAEGARSRADLPAYNAIIATVATDTGTVLIDHWNTWQAHHPTLDARRQWLADPIHPNTVGHTAFTAALLEVLGIDAPTPSDPN